jgi:phosphotriesterase-related protein
MQRDPRGEEWRLNAFSGKVITVRGPIDPADLGRTMTHEHLWFHSALFAETGPPTTSVETAPVSFDNLWLVRRNARLSRDNKDLRDIDAVVGEMAHFVADGGGAIVDVTTKGLHPDPTALRTISERSGVHVVAGTGYYRAAVRPPGFADRTVEDLADELIRDVRDGFEGTDVHAGVLGELALEGSGRIVGLRHIGELDQGDVRLLQAAARAQQATGAAIIVHPPKSHFRGVPGTALMHGVVDILEAAGADLRRVVIGHVDRDQWETVDTLSTLAARGVFLAMDQWGYEGYLLDAVPWLFPSDADRIRTVHGLIANGFLGQLLLSHDVCDKFQWRKFGGGSYSHLLKFVVPVMRFEGVTNAQIDQLFVANPARLLTIP